MIKLEEYILVIDDEKEILEIFAEFLTSEGYRVKTFTSPVAALESLKSRNYQSFLIISDFRMPDMDGLQFCEKVRTDGFELPFLLISAVADKATAVKGLSAGINDLLDKPIDLPILLKVVKKYSDLRIAQIEQEQREADEILEMYCEESKDLLSDLDQLILRLESENIDGVVIDSLFRKVHSVKGGAGAIQGGQLLASLGHEFESVLSRIKRKEFQPSADDVNLFLACADSMQKLLDLLRHKTPAPDDLVEHVKTLTNSLIEIKNNKDRQPQAGEQATSAPTVKKAKTDTATTSPDENASSDEGILVSNERLDSFMNLSGELIVLKNYFHMISRDVDMRLNPDIYEKRMQEFAYSLNKITDSLQDQITLIRKVTLERTFSKLPRIARKTAQDVEKKVLLKMSGLELGVDKNIAKSLSACMTHMIRNSIDHGIESPDKRMQNGKSPEGTVTVTAQEAQGIIQIIVADDGAGINTDRVLKKAIQNGLVTELQAKDLSDPEIFDLIFLPGFSTAEKVTGTSGRGVGMDVVKSEILNHNGRIRIESEVGKGSKFTLEIPVARAVMVEQTVLTKFSEATFAVPLTSISRIISCDQLEFSQMSNIRTCQFEGKTVKIRTYDEYLGNTDICDGHTLKSKSAIFMRYKNETFGLIVDQVQDQLEAVIRPFDAIVKKMPGFKGTTVLGNERIAYIVSPEHMSQLVTAEAG